MISSKHISKIAILLVSAVLILCVFAMAFSDKLFTGARTLGYDVEYKTALFDTSKITELNIVMDDEDWSEMLSRAIEEEYYQCNVEVNGTVFYNVGIRPKGNTSLSAVVNDPNNDRYSFKLEFDHFVDGQTCFGLDKLVLNNNYADATSMKEAIVYDMLGYLGADASLYNYAKISVNGKYWGVYLALEGVEDGFMLRNYGAESGFLYKPDGMDGGKKDGVARTDFKPQNRQEGDKAAEEPRQVQKPQGERGAAPGRGGSGGANLNYIDDALDSYETIWDSEVHKSTDADRKRVVKALKNISERKEIEKYIDVEQILRYMAVHNFSVNDDSLSGSMAHNYYLYEANGQISIVPWDYNLAFGGMNGKSASDVVNDPIDEKYSSTELFDFVFENEEYLNRYHELYGKLINEYIDSGKFDEVYGRIRGQIDDLVKNDPNAMYGFDEYTRAAETLYETVMLRAESVKGQLRGAIPSTKDGQRENPSVLVDAADISLSDMGEFMGGGRGGEHRDRTAEMPQNNEHDGEKNEFDNEERSFENIQKNGLVMPDMQPYENRGGQPPENMERGNAQPPERRGGQPPNNMGNDKNEDARQPENFNSPEDRDFKNRQQNQNGADGTDETERRDSRKSIKEHIKEYSMLYISLLLLAAAVIFVKLYKKRRY